MGDAITHKLIDSSSKKIIYRSAVRPADELHPNKRLVPDLGELSESNKHKPIKFIRSRQDQDKSVTKPMATYDPDDLVGRSFLLPPNEKGERHRATIRRKIIDVAEQLEEDQENLPEKIITC